MSQQSSPTRTQPDKRKPDGKHGGSRLQVLITKLQASRALLQGGDPVSPELRTGLIDLKSLISGIINDESLETINTLIDFLGEMHGDFTKDPNPFCHHQDPINDVISDILRVCTQRKQVLAKATHSNEYKQSPKSIPEKLPLTLVQLPEQQPKPTHQDKHKQSPSGFEEMNEAEEPSPSLSLMDEIIASLPTVLLRMVFDYITAKSEFAMKLEAAVESRDKDRVSKLLKENHELVDLNDAGIMAIAQKDKDILDLLMGNNRTLQIWNTSSRMHVSPSKFFTRGDGFTALMVAAEDTDSPKMLIKICDFLSFDIRAYTTHREIVDYVNTSAQGRSALTLARNNLLCPGPMLDLLLHWDDALGPLGNMAPSSETEGRWSSLMLAAATCSRKIVDIIVNQAGGDFNQLMVMGQDPYRALSLAAERRAPYADMYRGERSLGRPPIGVIDFSWGGTLAERRAYEQHMQSLWGPAARDLIQSLWPTGAKNFSSQRLAETASLPQLMALMDHAELFEYWYMIKEIRAAVHHIATFPDPGYSALPGLFNSRRDAKDATPSKKDQVTRAAKSIRALAYYPLSVPGGMINPGELIDKHRAYVDLRRALTALELVAKSLSTGKQLNEDESSALGLLQENRDVIEWVSKIFKPFPFPKAPEPEKSACVLQ